MATIRVINKHYHLDFYDESGRRHRKSLNLEATRENRSKALLEKKKIEYELGAGVYKERQRRIENRNKLLKEGFDEFLETKNKRSKKTIKHFENSFDKFYNQFGNIRIRSITDLHFEDLEAELKKDKIVNKKTKKGLSSNSIASYFNKLNQIFNFFVEKNYIDKNPVPTKKMKPKEIVTIPEKELQAILSLLRLKNREQYKVIFLLLATGMRSGELVRLEWKDIDLKNNIMTIKNYKVDRIDRIPIYNELREFLIKEYTEREGKVVRYSSYDSLNFFRRFLKREGFRHYSIHTLRKTYISRLVNSGLSVYDVMTLARHKSIQTTLKHYTAAELSRMGKEVSQRAKMGTFLGTKIKEPLKLVKTG